MPTSGVWSAPGRVNLIGEHTDYNDGFALPIAIGARAVVSLRLHDDRVVHLRSVQQPGSEVSTTLDGLAPGSPSGWAAYMAGSLWAAHRAGYPLTGLDLMLDSEVAIGTGLGSSHALQCAALVGLRDLMQWNCSLTDLAKLTQVSENEFADAPTGLMDPLASLYGKAQCALLLDLRNVTFELIPFDPSSAGLRLLVIDTGVRHDNAEGAYGERRRACAVATETLGVAALRDVTRGSLNDAFGRLEQAGARALVRHVVNENQRVLDAAAALRVGDWTAIGRLMSESHISLRDDYRVSCAELDVTVDAMLAAGALGARMTGGGFGGCAIALIRGAALDETTERVSAAFRAQGWQAPSIMEVMASDGARQE